MLSNFFFTGGVTVLHPLVLADIVQVERLTEAMGWEILAVGTGYGIGTPIATLVNLWTGNIHTAYLVAGLVMAAGGFCVILVRFADDNFTDDDVERLRRRLEAALS